jgi:hypothetical protein
MLLLGGQVGYAVTPAAYGDLHRVLAAWAWIAIAEDDDVATGLAATPTSDLIGRPLTPMRRVHVNYAICPYFDPATVTEATGEPKGVLAVIIYHRHHQVAVFRDRIERANEAPHAIFLQRLCKFRIDLTQSICAQCEERFHTVPFRPTFDGPAFDDKPVHWYSPRSGRTHSGHGWSGAGWSTK